MTAPPRVLYLTHRVPFPPDKGDRIRTFHLLRELAARGRVWLGCPADEPVPPAARAALGALCERVELVPVGRRARWARAALSAATGGSLSEGLFASAALRRTVRGWAAGAGFACAVASSSALVPYLKVPELRGVPKVIDLIDVDSQKWLDFAARARPPARWAYRFEAARVRARERALPGWARAVAVVSRAEADLFDALARPGAATVATNGVDLEYFAPVAAPEEPALAFVGALDYFPNADAAVWFARAVLPLVRARVPGAEFRIVGRNPTAAVRALAAVPGVRLVGPVPDVRPFVTGAAAAVVPLRLARGVQNKVLEAMALGKAVVAAPAALAALGAEPGVHLLRATDPGEWAAAATALLTDPARRAALGRAARAYVEAHHHWGRCLAPLVAAVFQPASAP